MLKATQQTKIDPSFAAIEAHRRAVITRLPILETRGTTSDKGPDNAAIDDALDVASDVETAATVELRDVRPTTVAGIKAIAAYYVEHSDQHHDWIGGEITGEEVGDFEPRSFEGGLLRRRGGRRFSLDINFPFDIDPPGPRSAGFFLACSSVFNPAQQQ